MHDKVGLEAYGYHRRPQSAHIQRSIDERLRVRAAWAWALSPGRASQPTRDMGSRFFFRRRVSDWQAQYQQRRYNLPGPRTAALKLPLGPNGAAGSAAFAAFGAQQRPVTAPA